MPQARAAIDLHKSIGLATHMGYINTIYGNRTLIKDMLTELKVVSLRDDCGGNSRGFMQELGQDLGCKYSVVFNNYYGSQTPTSYKDELKALGTQYVEYAEGTNEPNYSYWQYNPQNADGAVQLHKDMYNAVKGDSATAHIPVASPSVDGDRQAFAGKFGHTVEVCNGHPYVGQMKPENRVHDFFNECNYVYGTGKPYIATETGSPIYPHWHPSNAVTPRYQALAALRIYLSYFKAGISRSYIYQLIDDLTRTVGGDRGETFGLADDQGNKRFSYYAIKRLVGLIADNAPPATLGSVNYSFSGQPEDFNDLLVQKSDGTYVLFCYSTMQNINWSGDGNVSPTDRAYTPANVTVNLGKTFSKVEVYEPLTQDGPVATHNNVSSVVVKGHDFPVALVLTPGSESPAPVAGLVDMRINCGSDVDYTDPAGLVWKADIYRTGGSTTSNTATIAKTHKEGLYQTSVWGSGDGLIHYAIPYADLGNGQFFTVHIRTMEGAFEAVGQRKFNIDIENIRFGSDIDPFLLTGGKYVAGELKWDVDRPDGALTMDIRFSRGTIDNPDVHAIEIRSR